MDKLEKQINEYMMLGYSVNEILDCMKVEIETIYNGDVDKFYLLVKNIFEAARTKMSSEDYEALKVLRKEHAEEIKLAKYKRVADKVKEKTEEVEKDYSSLKDALAYAVQSVANYEGVTNAVVRNYTRLIHPEFYEYYFNNMDITDDQLVAIAQKIIDKDMYESVASRLKHYSKMIEYIKVNRPDLLEQIKAVYASHTNNNFNKMPQQNEKSIFINFEYLEKIICEFRPSINKLLEFINSSSIFATRAIESEDELINLLYAEKNSIYHNSIRWYLTEAALPDDFTDYRNERFKAFANKFFAFEKIEDCFKYVKVVTAINLKSITEKVDQQQPNEKYGFTMDENRQLVRWCYNYALTRIDLEKRLFFKPTDKKFFVGALEESEDLYDKMLVDGSKRLNEYYKDIEASIKNGRK